MGATLVLRSEHGLIDRVLGALILMADRMDSGVPPPAAFIEGALDFIAAFVDDCHHAKEELLFDVLEARPDTAPPVLLADLREQHGAARRRLEALRSGGTGLARGLRDYARFMGAHLEQEEGDLFPRVDAVLLPAEAAAVARAWDELEARVAGPAARAALFELAETIVTTCVSSERSSPGRPPTARDLMRPDVPAVSPEDTLTRAADVMARLEIRELPVVAAGRLVGIITHRDTEPHRGHFEWTTVSTAMTHDPVTVPPDADAASVAMLLLSRAFNAVPVAAGGTVVGMLARADLLRLIAAH